MEKNGVIRFAPIYDCGSSLGALFSDDKMCEILKDDTTFKNTEYNVKSCYSLKGKRIFYHEIFRSPTKELEGAIKRMIPLIDMNIIHSIVNTTDIMSDIRKEYLIRALNMRYSEILLPAHRRTVKKSNLT